MKAILRLLLAVIVIPLATIGLFFVASVTVILSTPDVRDLKGCIIAKMHQVPLCSKNSDYVPLRKISPIAVAAILASEDTTFYQHNGFDWYEIKNSFSKDMYHKGFVRGGSTITQQLAKNVYLSGTKSLVRKAREAFLTYQLEKYFTKDFILEKYLNVVEFGPEIYGIKPAARYYFKKTPDQLNVLESAFLAFLLPNPKGYYKSFRDRKLTRFARSRVVDISYRLLRFKKITPVIYDQARNLVDQFPWTGLVKNDLGGNLSEAAAKIFAEGPEDNLEETPALIQPSSEEHSDEDGDDDEDDDQDVVTAAQPEKPKPALQNGRYPQQIEEAPAHSTAKQTEKQEAEKNPFD